MNGKAVSGVILTLLLIGMLTLAFNIQSVKASGTIYIRADGSVDPPTAPIQNVGNMYYTFTADMYEAIVIERDNIVVDGAGYVVQGIEEFQPGISLFSRSNVTIRNCRVIECYVGFWLENSSNNTLSNNTASNNLEWGFVIYTSSNNNTLSNNTASSNTFYGIGIWSSHNNTISGNTVSSNVDFGIRLSQSRYNTISENKVSSSYYGVGFHQSSHNNTLTGNNIFANDYGIMVGFSRDNKIFHNNLVNKENQVIAAAGYADIWDDGYPSGGNYWSDYTGMDADGDGIGDTAYVIDEYNRDNYPLMDFWNSPWGNWTHYHNYTEINNTLRFLNTTYSNIVDVFSIGKSWQNQDIYCIRLTNESNTHPKPKLFFVGYHHARELISAELPLYFAVEAATKIGTNETITHMVNYSEIYIVPALNIDAFDAVKQNEWQRKNVHPFDEDSDSLLDEDPPEDQDGDGYIEDLFYWDGTNYYFIRWEGIDNDSDGSYNEDWVGGVDLNRNYGYQWNATCDSGSPYPWAEDYRGPTPFSEPETQAIRDLALTHDFKYAISFHSGTEVIGYPWGYTTDQTPDDAIFREIAANLSQLVGAPYGQNSGLYTASGMWDDWMYANRSTFALTCEIYTNNSAWQYEPGPDPDTWWEKGVFQFFNPNPHDIETVIQRWLPVFTYVTDRAITEAYDVTTTNITPLKTIVGQGFSIQINVTVTNQGYFTETFNVTVYANTNLIETKSVTLTSGSSTTITFTWNTTGFAKGNYTISAKADIVPGEIAITDNKFTNGEVKVTVPGDVTGEGLCDMQDISILVDKFLAQPPNPLYDPNCDVNNDGVIDIGDISIAVDNFLKDP